MIFAGIMIPRPGKPLNELSESEINWQIFVVLLVGPIAAVFALLDAAKHPYQSIFYTVLILTCIAIHVPRLFKERRRRRDSKHQPPAAQP